MKLKLLALVALTAVTANSFAIDIADRNDLEALEKRVDALSISHSSALAREAERTNSVSAVQARPATPDWVLNVPESERAIFAVGIGVSNNEQRSIDKAVLNAERRLIEVVNSEVETATRSTSFESGDDVQETYESLTRKNAYGQLIGTMRVKTHQIIDGNRYRTYVMMALPMDENNPIRKQRETRQMKLDAETRNRLSYDNLDQQLRERQARDREDQLRRESNLRPLESPKVVQPPVKSSEVPIEQSLLPNERVLDENAPAGPGVVITPISSNSIVERKASDMSAEEKYKITQKVTDPTIRDRLDAAMSKPDAVVVSTTIR